MVDTRTPLRHESADGRIGIVRLEELYEGPTGVEPHDPGAVGTIQLDFPETQDVAEEGHGLAQGPDCDADVGYADSARGCRGH